jgi:ankyrin repeat protein
MKTILSFLNSMIVSFPIDLYSYVHVMTMNPIYCSLVITVFLSIAFLIKYIVSILYMKYMQRKIEFKIKRKQERTDLHFASGALKERAHYEEKYFKKLPWRRRERTLDVSLIKSLVLSNPESLLVQDFEGLLPLHYACDRHEEPGIEILKLLTLKNEAINVVDNDGKTPLHYAASHRRLETVKYLLSCGADASIRDNNGATPLYWSLYWEDESEWNDEDGPILFPPTDVELIRILVTAYPDAIFIPASLDSIGGDLEKYDTKLKGRCFSGKFPLFECCLRPMSLEAVELLLPSSTSPFANFILNSVDFNYYTPLHNAVQIKNQDLCELLLKHGATVDGARKIITYGCDTPLTLCRDINCAKVLLQYGADATRLINEICGSYHDLRLPQEIYALAFQHLLSIGYKEKIVVKGKSIDLVSLSLQYDEVFRTKLIQERHIHPLVKNLGWNKGCDICNTLAPTYIYSCTSCSSWDECESCFKKRENLEQQG